MCSKKTNSLESWGVSSIWKCMFFHIRGLQCELYHWVDLLDRFDLILNEAAQQADENQRSKESEEVTSCVFLCPKLEDPKASSCDKIQHVLMIVHIFSVFSLRIKW